VDLKAALQEIDLVSQLTEVKSVVFKDVGAKEELIDNAFVFWLLQSEQLSQNHEELLRQKKNPVKITAFLEECGKFCQEKVAKLKAL